jgi:hypothetical protein
MEMGPRVITNGLVLALDAADLGSYPGSGTVWSDLSGNTNNGTLTNGPTFDANNGGSVVFDGVNDYVNCGNILDSLTDLSLECFVKFGAQSANYGGIISKTLSNADGWELRVGNSSLTTTTIQFRYVGDSSYLTFNTSTNGVWYHLVATGKLNSQKIYINGSLYDSRTDALTPSANINSLVIGKLAYAGIYVNMSLAYARIYNKALTATEVLQNYNALKPRFKLN